MTLEATFFPNPTLLKGIFQSLGLMVCQISHILSNISYFIIPYYKNTHTWTGMNYPWSTAADIESVNDINSSMDLLNWSYSLEMLGKYQIYTKLNWDLCDSSLKFTSWSFQVKNLFSVHHTEVLWAVKF